ncbi:uncharacterized protein LOC123564895 [Mercenaria mercenaria]|uniref:uncharacterized protein LOC123564895 n=1 Tax=Mercenaria mercenaria TaxID=6596 RepID=UPI001E1D4485|nr:uncharacterized protein LOC123564895 [Mercenaria mercenaria]
MASSSSLNWSKKLNEIPKFTILQIADYIKVRGKNRAFEKGYNFFIESYVHDAFVCKTDSKFLVKAKCWRSQKKNELPHILSAEICLKESNVLDGQCSCIAGTGGVCNHIIALLYNVNHWSSKRMTEIPADMSCTEVSQIWHKPRGDKIEPEPVMKLTFAKAATDRQLRKREPVKCYLYDGRAKKSKGTLAPSKEEVATIQEIVGARNSNIPIVYLTKDHSTTHSTDTLFGEVPTGSPLSYQLQDYHSSKSEFSAYIPSKVDIVLQDNLRFPDIPVPNSSLNIDLTQLDETSKTFLQSLDVTKARSEEIEQITIDQSQNKLWHEMRKNRLTASKFGDVINRKSEPSEAFVKNLFTCKDLSSVKSISHGRDKEDTARKLYTKKMKNNCKHNVSVFRTGLLINPSVLILELPQTAKF